VLPSTSSKSPVRSAVITSPSAYITVKVDRFF
jgi:hypothetical protein